MPIDNDGIMVILSSPSGAGKTTLVNLLSKTKDFEVSISHTTRKPRQNEVPDKDYYFVDEEKFRRLIKNEEFLEYAKVFNNFYGTTRTPVIDKLNKGKNVLFDIDWQGAEQLSRHAELNLLKIFILPPSLDELKKRLVSRNQDDKEAIKRRLNAYSIDVTKSKNYDYVLVNDKVDNCFNEIKKIIVKFQNQKN